METNKQIKNMKNFNMVLSARLFNRELGNQAVEMQDRLSEKSGSWSGEEEIRKWRQKH